MTIKFEIIMTNRGFYSLITIGIVLTLGIGVWAYQSNMQAGNPAVMGHSAGEINVENYAGEIVSLQDALDDLKFNNGATYVSAINGSFSILYNSSYVLIAKAYQYSGDSNYRAYLYIDGEEVDNNYIGDHVRSGGDGGGANEALFIGYKYLTKGLHQFKIQGVTGSPKFVVFPAI